MRRSRETVLRALAGVEESERGVRCGYKWAMWYGGDYDFIL